MDTTYGITAQVKGQDAIAKFYNDLQKQITKTSDAAQKAWDKASKAVAKSQASATKAVSAETKAQDKALAASVKAGMQLRQQALNAQKQGLAEAQRWNNQYFRQQEQLLRGSLKKQETDYDRYLKTMRARTMATHVFEFGEHVETVAGFFEGQFSGMDKYVEAAKKLALARLQFRSLGLSEGENTEAFKAVDDLVGRFKGATISETTETLKDLTAATGGLHHALTLLDTASKYKYGFETIFQGKFTPAQIRSQINDAARYLELTGAINKSAAEANKEFNMLAKVTESTGGAVDPSMMLQAAKMAGPAWQTLSERGRVEMVAMMQEYKGMRSGTNLAAMNRALVQGLTGLAGQKGKGKEYTKEWVRLMGKGGMAQIKDTFAVDPLQAMDTLAAAMKAKGVNVDYDKESGNLTDVSRRAVTSEIYKLFPTQTAQRGAVTFLTQPGRVRKGMQAYDRAPDIETAAQKAHEDMLGKLKEYEIAQENFQARVGLPMLKLGTDLAQAWMPFLKLFAEYPKTSLAAIVGTKGLFAAWQSITYLRMASQISDIAQATEGAGETAVVAGGRLARLSATMSKLNQMRSLQLSVAVIGAVEVLAVYAAWKEMHDAQEDEKKTARQTEEGQKKLNQINPQGGAQTEFTGAQTWAILNSGGRLQEGMGAGFWSRTGALFNPFDWKILSNEFFVNLQKGLGEHAPQLARSNVMKSFLQYERGLTDVTGGERKNLEDALSKAFPESYKQASAELKDSSTQFGAAVPQLLSATTQLMTTSEILEAAAGHLAKVTPSEGGGTGQPPLPGPHPFNTFVNDTLHPKKHALGGIIRRPLHLFGEAGPEAVIPLNKAQRAGAFGGPMTFHYAPVINAAGLSEAQLDRVLEKHADHVIRLLDRKYKDRRLTA